MKKNEFSCERCAECCKKLTVKITKKEIEKIKKLGIDDFFEYDKFIDSDVLKRKENSCIFLQGNECRIYRNRPETCIRYPFYNLDEVDDCKPEMFGNKN